MSTILLHLLGGGDGVVRAGKDEVDFFQFEIRRLGIEEVNDGYEDQVGHREDQIGLPLETVDYDRSYHHLGAL